MPLADRRELAFGALAGAALCLQAALDLLGAALELGHARGQLGFRASEAGALGGGALLGLGELAAQLLDAPREIAAVLLAGSNTARELLVALATLALQAGEAVLGLDAQLLLGVLALLDPAQLAVALGAVCALGVQQLPDPSPFLLGVAQPLLQARDMAFERLDRGFGGLRPAQQGGLAGLGGAARAPFGQEVGLPHAARRARARCLALLDHALQGRYCGERTAPGRLRRFAERISSQACPRTPTSATGG